MAGFAVDLLVELFAKLPHVGLCPHVAWTLFVSGVTAASRVNSSAQHTMALSA